MHKRNPTIEEAGSTWIELDVTRSNTTDRVDRAGSDSRARFQKTQALQGNLNLMKEMPTRRATDVIDSQRP